MCTMCSMKFCAFTLLTKDLHMGWDLRYSLWSQTLFTSIEAQVSLVSAFQLGWIPSYIRTNKKSKSNHPTSKSDKLWNRPPWKVESTQTYRYLRRSLMDTSLGVLCWRVRYVVIFKSFWTQQFMIFKFYHSYQAKSENVGDGFYILKRWVEEERGINSAHRLIDSFNTVDTNIPGF